MFSINTFQQPRDFLRFYGIFVSKKMFNRQKLRGIKDQCMNHTNYFLGDTFFFSAKDFCLLKPCNSNLFIIISFTGSKFSIFVTSSSEKLMIEKHFAVIKHAESLFQDTVMVRLAYCFSFQRKTYVLEGLRFSCNFFTLLVY